MRHIKCIAFLRPTPQSIQAVIEELKDPLYGDYYLYFTNALQKSAIERLAEGDTHEVVREVQEYFADYVSLQQDLFSLNLTSAEYPLFSIDAPIWNPLTLTRTLEGVVILFKH
jgi:hypothetical protein